MVPGLGTPTLLPKSGKGSCRTHSFSICSAPDHVATNLRKRRTWRYGAMGDFASLKGVHLRSARYGVGFKEQRDMCLDSGRFRLGPRCSLRELQGRGAESASPPVEGGYALGTFPRSMSHITCPTLGSRINFVDGCEIHFAAQRRWKDGMCLIPTSLVSKCGIWSSQSTGPKWICFLFCFFFGPTEAFQPLERR